jgi:capsular exopolysaccharide synthesis family protein
VETDRGAGVTTDRQAVSDLNAQLTQIQADVTARKVRYELAQRIRAAGGSLEALPEAASSHIIEDLRKSETEVAGRLADASRVYADTFPEVRRLREQQALLQKQIAAEIGRIVDGLRVEYETAAARERTLRDRLAQSATLENSTAKSDGRIQLRDAQRLVEENRTLHDSLLGRLRDVQQQQTREEPEARIISRAEVPSRPSSPKPFLLPAGGAAGFLLLGLGFTLAPALLESRFVSVADVERRLGLLVFGGMPLLRRRDLAAPRRRSSIADYAARMPLSHFAESLRALRAHLRISADGHPSILQVTSAIPGEGKSTTAAALAMSAATAGVRTVLVDVDLRSASLSAMFGLRHEEGLTEILELGLPYRSVIRELDDVPLAVIGAGSTFMPRPDLVNSAQFDALLRELTRHYALVILDTPPVLPVSDALVIARHADATMLVVEWRATAKKLAEQAVKMLRTVNAPLVGVMLNKVDVSKVSQYEYQYGYGPQGARRRDARSSRA